MWIISGSAPSSRKPAPETDSKAKAAGTTRNTTSDYGKDTTHGMDISRQRTAQG